MFFAITILHELLIINENYFKFFLNKIHIEYFYSTL